MKCARCGKDFGELFNTTEADDGTVCAVCYVVLSDEIIKRDRLLELKQRRESALKGEIS